jgi:hypothetical protein
MDEQNFWVRLEYRIGAEWPGTAAAHAYRQSANRSPEEIDWSALMPSDRSTGWLLPDLRARAMTMNPLSGLPGLSILICR